MTMTEGTFEVADLKIGAVAVVGETKDELAIVEVVAVITTAEGTAYRVRVLGQKREREVAAAKVWRLVRPEAV
jgi:predicted metalloprotease